MSPPEDLMLNLELELGLEGLGAVGTANPDGDHLRVRQRLVNLNKRFVGHRPTGQDCIARYSWSRLSSLTP